MSSPFRLTLVVLAGFALLPLAHAGLESPPFSRFGQISVRGSNQTFPLDGGGLYFITEDSSDYFTDGLFHSYSSNLSYTGLDRNYEERTMNFDGTGYVQGNYGVLKTRYEGSLTNALFNEENIPLYNSQTEEYDSSGVPDVMDGVATAGWTDKLQYGGTATGYLSTYVFRITGFNENFKSFSLLDINLGSSSQRFTLFETGVTDKIIRTTPVFIGMDGLTAEIQLSSFFQPNLKELPDGGFLHGDSNFANTVELVGIELTDLNGIPVSGVGITGASGTLYQPVPEPGTLVLCGGLLAMGLTRLGKKRAA